MLPARVPTLVLLAAAALAARPAAATPPGPACEKTVAAQLRACVRKLGKLELQCHQDTGTGCTTGHPKVAAVLTAASAKVSARCPDQATVTAAGFPATLTPPGLVLRLQSACTGAVESLVARSFGGPHAASRATAGATDRTCLDTAFHRGLKGIDYAVRQQSRCVVKVRAGGTCDTGALTAKLAARDASTAMQIARKCPAGLDTLVAVDAQTFVARGAAQSRCLVATAHGQPAPLALDCGPRAAVPVPPRATATQIVLDPGTWGTRCGDGSPYAFWIRLPPTGLPARNVVVYLQGGGACVSGPDCASQPAGRFEALSDGLVQGGLMSSTNPANPFRDWTKVFLPYCTQDVHIGGGVTNLYPEITVHRFGAVNVRTAMRYVRDLLWADLDATEPDGYRDDRIRAVLSGGSAGAFGTSYNYHWVLDDLRWPRTTAAPDAGLGIDNGLGTGVIALGALALLPADPGLGSLPYLPPYCRTAACAEILANLMLATAPRLERLPEQQILSISNQVDQVQVDTTLFPSTVAWTNALRANYCSVQGATGVHAFYTASTASVHGQAASASFFGVQIGGTTMASWLGGAVATPGSAVDKIATGTLETDYPGVLPFPCAVGSPSGAFLP